MSPAPDHLPWLRYGTDVTVLAKAAVSQTGSIRPPPQEDRLVSVRLGGVDLVPAPASALTAPGALGRLAAGGRRCPPRLRDRREARADGHPSVTV